MKTKYLDAEIERLNLLERNEELTDWGKEMLSELKEIKQSLFIPRVVVNEAIKEFNPCGQGKNICKCKDSSECGYNSEVALCEHDYQPDITCGVDITACSKCGDVI